MGGENLTDPFGAIFERQYDTALRVARKMLPESDAEDVASETMLRVGTRLSEGVPADGLEALVPIIAYGLAVDEYRRGEIPAGLGQESDWLGHLIANQALTLEQDEFATAFDAGVRGLTEDDFAAFTLTDLRGLPERTAAGLLGTSQKTVNRRRGSARNFLREEITA